MRRRRARRTEDSRAFGALALPHPASGASAPRFNAPTVFGAHPLSSHDQLGSKLASRLDLNQGNGRKALSHYGFVKNA
jgi:hypothetical protein